MYFIYKLLVIFFKVNVCLPRSKVSPTIVKIRDFNANFAKETLYKIVITYSIMVLL